LYYEKYFELLLSETKYNNYCGHELLKVEIIVRRNNDGSYG
jgi:hypothetical protein